MFLGLRREVRSLPPPPALAVQLPGSLAGARCCDLPVDTPGLSAVLLSPKPRLQDHMAGGGGAAELGESTLAPKAHSALCRGPHPVSSHLGERVRAVGQVERGKRRIRL